MIQQSCYLLYKKDNPPCFKYGPMQEHVTILACPKYCKAMYQSKGWSSWNKIPKNTCGLKLTEVLGKALEVAIVTSHYVEVNIKHKVT